MNRAQKTELAQELRESFATAKVALFADYKGLTATQADELRRLLRQNGGKATVLKNNVGRLISKDGSMGEDTKQLMDTLVGPTLIAFAYEDPAAVAKVIAKFAKDNEAFTIKDSLMTGRKVSAAEVEALASLPSREVLLGMLLAQFNAPVAGFARLLAAVPRSFVLALAAIERKKGGNA